MEPGWLSRPGPTRRGKGRAADGERSVSAPSATHCELARVRAEAPEREVQRSFEPACGGEGAGATHGGSCRTRHTSARRPSTAGAASGESTAAAQSGARRRAAGGRNPTSKMGAGERHHTGRRHRPAAPEAAVGGGGGTGLLGLTRHAPHNRLSHGPRGSKTRPRARHQRARREPIDIGARLHRAPSSERHRSLACGGRTNGTHAMLN